MITLTMPGGVHNQAVTRMGSSTVALPGDSAGSACGGVIFHKDWALDSGGSRGDQFPGDAKLSLNILGIIGRSSSDLPGVGFKPFSAVAQY